MFFCFHSSYVFSSFDNILELNNTDNEVYGLKQCSLFSLSDKNDLEQSSQLPVINLCDRKVLDETNQFSVISTCDREALVSLRKYGFFDSLYMTRGGRYSIVTVTSQEEIDILTFRKQRTKELALMKEELKALQRMLFLPGIRRSQEEVTNIMTAIRCYQDLISQRKSQERLNSSEFFSLYEGNFKQLQEDVQATKNRLSGIN
jgi:hypothetical protein